MTSRTPPGEHQIVGQEDGDRVLVVVEEVLDAADGVAEAQRLLLDDRGDFEEVGRLADLGQHGLLAALGEGVLQDEVLHEVRDDAVLARRGDDQEPIGTRRLGFLGDQLDAGRIDHRQQLFGHRLGGGGEEPRPPARRPGRPRYAGSAGGCWVPLRTR